MSINRYFSLTMTAVMLGSMFAPAAGAQASPGGGPPDHANSQGPDRTVEGVNVLDSTTFEVEFDKTYPAGIDISRMIEPSVALEDGTTVEPELTDYEVNEDDRSTVTVEHTDDDLAELAGTLLVGDEEDTFDFTPDDEFDGSTIQEVRDQPDEEHTIQGTVTAAFEEGGATNMYIEDDTAAIVIRGENLGNLYDRGDLVEATGTGDDYYGMLQFPTDEENTELIEEDAGLVEPEMITSEKLRESGEDYHAQLVEMTDVDVADNFDFDDYNASDSAGEFVMLGNHANISEETNYDSVTGVINYNFGVDKLMPRDNADLVEDADRVQPVEASPESTNVAEGTEVELNTATEDATIYYTLDGTDPTEDSQVYDSPIELTEDTEIRAIAVADELENSAIASFEYTIRPEAGELEIYDIQGAAHTSPYEGTQVTEVPGIVTHVENNGYYMQSEESDGDNNTSEGIYVYHYGHDVSEGDLVHTSGEVVEYEEDGFDGNNDLTTTQIAADESAVQSSGNELPDAVVIGEDRQIPEQTVADPDTYDPEDPSTFDADVNAIDFYESLEGMKLEIPEQVTVTGPQSYGELTVVSEQWDIDNRTPEGGVYLTEDEDNPEIMFVNVPRDTVAKTGDYFDESVTGVLTYDFSNFKLEPVDGGLPELQEGDAERRENTTIEFDEDQLTVATYNVENFHPDADDTRRERLAHSMANELDAPDVIALVEVMSNSGDTDDGTVEADESYQTLIDEIAAQGGPDYDYIDIPPKDGVDGGIPGGNIRVGYIYRTDRVEIPDGEIGGSTDALEFDEDGELNYVTGRIDPENDAFESSRVPLMTEFNFKGESVYVIGNHWNSKRGDEAPMSMDAPAEQNSREQRDQIATVVRDFVRELEENKEQPNVVVGGDFNEFPWASPVQILEDDGMLYNAIYELPRENQFTYNYEGNAQSLDSILVSDHLQDGLDVDVMNINSKFMEEHGRASDHDPMVVQLDVPDIDPDYDYGDTTAPEITFEDAALNDDPSMTLEVGEEFAVPAVTAEDETDGDLTDEVNIENNVDTSESGDYEVVYSVTDEAGNKGTLTLEVRVLTDADGLEDLANGDFSDWTDGMPDAWNGEATNFPDSRVSQSDEAVTGDYSLALENTTASHNRFTTESYAIADGTTYEVSYEVKGSGNIRNAMYAPDYHGNGYSGYSDYTEIRSDDDWETITWEYEAPGDGEAELIFSASDAENLVIDNVEVEVAE
ncbi:chitobiase/beta-hexosaminidase C-terminal domain-containing protein [Salisediminibacterium halotolerans]|uniref:chitobiase/beta-hexosaminidase C-terminal domain-containing protein n=1 Tax=Salisediminibacterium halotolerans TaxID=517425 RepID=UPI000EAF29F4|nr:chitobiase/beta-hexosaminidase C-terminal domain-containing protein [Salisediminibacterium halotolerans]RLJ75630.1 hypothetical protein BCL39_1147 [Actinophytocola xinjiangensis]RPE89484.1 putative extracellular nuclease [Salisediminibacterium halotolerans]TWG36243.1 hypothetical protein BCL52_1144 [Salisediminibacterium halotolerans]GEL08271.1 hypothetical protein SHA02_16870 [Salisediminibacterium halotolerans]